MCVYIYIYIYICDIVIHVTKQRKAIPSRPPLEDKAHDAERRADEVDGPAFGVLAVRVLALYLLLAIVLRYLFSLSCTYCREHSRALLTNEIGTPDPN